MNQDNLILLFDCNVYIILVIFCNGGAAGVWGSVGVVGAAGPGGAAGVWGSVGVVGVIVMFWMYF